jgi:hypothetical protein
MLPPPPTRGAAWTSRAASLARLAVGGRRVVLRPGEALVVEGDAGDAVFVVERGCLLVTRAAADGRPDAVIGWAGGGDLVGELAVLCRAPRCATVTAQTEVVAWRVGARAFAGAMSTDPCLAMGLARSVAGIARGVDAPTDAAQQTTLTLYLPRAPEGSAAVLAASRRFLAGLFGGATMHDATGTWRSAADGLVDDELCLVRVCAGARAVAAHLPAVLAHAREVRDRLGEEAVAVEVDGRMALV